MTCEFIVAANSTFINSSKVVSEFSDLSAQKLNGFVYMYVKICI